MFLYFRKQTLSISGYLSGETGEHRKFTCLGQLFPPIEMVIGALPWPSTCPVRTGRRAAFDTPNTEPDLSTARSCWKDFVCYRGIFHPGQRIGWSCYCTVHDRFPCNELLTKLFPIPATWSRYHCELGILEAVRLCTFLPCPSSSMKVRFLCRPH